MSSEEIPFVVEVQTKGRRDVGFANVSVDRLSDSLKSATSMLAKSLDDIRQVGKFELEEVVVGFEVSAEGGVHFIGTSKVGGRGSITLKFSPPKDR